MSLAALNFTTKKLQIARFSSVSQVMSAKNGYQLLGFGTG